MVTDPLRRSAEVEQFRDNAMNLPSRDVFLGLTIGAICATALAAIGPGFVADAFADEMPAGFDTDGLVKIEDRYYRMDYEPWVATDPVSTARVKKIEAGRVSYVDITTTDTGTYSTDGLTSQHVLYPGIEVEAAGPQQARFHFWSGGRWTRFATRNANSYVSVSSRSDGRSSTCVIASNVRVC